MFPISLRSLSFLDALWPPVEQGGGADEVGPRLKGDAACGLGVLKVVDGGEMAVGERGVGERPEMLGGLQFGRIRRQEEQVDMLGDAQFAAGVPAGAVQDEHDLLRWAGADLRGRTRPARPRRAGCETLVARWKTRAGPRRDGRSRRDSASRSGAGPAPSGAAPSKHQTLCRIGFRPMRCSSVAQSSTCAWGKAVATACTSGLSFF